MALQSDTVVNSPDELPDVEHLSDLLCTSIVTDSSRLALYKNRARDETSQEERRRLLLDHQKEKREQLINSRRSIETDKDDKWRNEKHFIENEDDMDWTTIKNLPWHKRGKQRRHELMFSEWLVDLPNDLDSKWIAVPCPIGRRNLIITHRFQGRATCFSKSGDEIFKFRSSLPPNTILDCISLKDKRCFYALDVIQWNGLSLKNCQSDFRFYWLEGQLKDNVDYSVISDRNENCIKNLPRYMCTEAELTQMMSRDPIITDCNVDGILFYHNETHYFRGTTPLVGWLKPYMLPEALGIVVPSKFAAPKSFSFKEFIVRVNQRKEDKKKKQKKNQKRKNKKMECEEIVSKNDEESSVGDTWQGVENSIDEMNCDVSEEKACESASEMIDESIEMDQ